MPKQKPGFVKTQYDELTYKVNGLAMQVHNELEPGHRERFYQRRLAELCRASGLEVNPEQRVEVWVDDMLVGYMFLDLWIENQLVVECKARSHLLTNDEVFQAVSYLAATGTEVGMIYNFGRPRLEYRRIFPPSQIQDWQKSLYRAIWVKPGMSLPPLDTVETVPPIRFVVQGTDRTIEVPIRAATHNLLSSFVHPLTSVSYESAGVSIDSGNRAVELMKEAVRSTYTDSVLAGIGSFGGLFDASAIKQMDHPVLVASTDGVGTKVKLAASVSRYRGIGHDIVNHCINDILVQGARPLFFMDYFATSKLNPEQTAEVVTGIAEACKAVGMALLGGETAEMPGIYQPDEFDVAGTIVGAVEREAVLPLSTIQAGDVLIGFQSSGPHTNGYSLIRKVFENTSLDTSLTEALLAPHRSYFNLLCPLLHQVKALVHITGGGFIENIPRVLPENLSAAIHVNSWQVPSFWELIRQKGNIATDEMYRVFNMGIGMIAIVDKSIVADFQSAISESTFVIGELVQGQRNVILS
jgi:phosphoribosylformylglycinamidine cyclo-ligase/phosphoribosylamine--glycine ligase/phosphoribosylformylglycinamidine cyclo-ligase